MKDRIDEYIDYIAPLNGIIEPDDNLGYKTQIIDQELDTVNISFDEDDLMIFTLSGSYVYLSHEQLIDIYSRIKNFLKQ